MFTSTTNTKLGTMTLHFTQITEDGTELHVVRLKRSSCCKTWLLQNVWSVTAEIWNTRKWWQVFYTKNDKHHFSSRK